ncbi:hypothetical protein ABVT39_006150 [Epinephelus coioides]
MCEGDTRLQRHYDAQLIFKGTSSTVQNELLDCMYEVYRDEIAKQVDKTSFVAIQADETTDVSCKSQMVVVLRYMLPNNTVTERFLEFVEVKDKTGLGLCNSIKDVLEPLKLGEKLIAQTYDGAAVMSGNVRGCMEDIRTQPGWDEATISEAYGLSEKLWDRAFLQLLEFFSMLMPEVDILYNTLQKRSIDGPGINSALSHFKENVQKMREQTDELAATVHNGADEPGRRVTNTAPVMKEACDTGISQVEQRFSQSDHLIAAKLVDTSLFPDFVQSFPTQFDCAVKIWPVGNHAMLSIENQLIQQLPDFIPKVIEKFAQRKNCRAAFLFK